MCNNYQRSENLYDGIDGDVGVLRVYDIEFLSVWNKLIENSLRSILGNTK